MYQIAKIGTPRKTKKIYYGSQAPNWKGGKCINAEGYALFYSPTHPYKNNDGYVREHRLVMEQFVGRYLKPDEVVHHKDCNKQNNHISNLELITPSRHMMLHRPKGEKCPHMQKDMSNRFCFFCRLTSNQVSKHKRNGRAHWLNGPVEGSHVCVSCYYRERKQTQQQQQQKGQTKSTLIAL